MKNDEQLWMMNDDKMMMTTDRSQRASSGSQRHHRRPTSEQRNTAPSSKADERAAEHRANVEGRRASSGSLRHRRLERNDSGLQSIERHQSIISSPIIISCLCLHRDHHYSHCGSRVSININDDWKNLIVRWFWSTRLRFIYQPFQRNNLHPPTKITYHSTTRDKRKLPSNPAQAKN